MDDDKFSQTLRQMAWERAKGELQSILHTYWLDEDGFAAANKAISEFIENVEDNGIGGLG